MAWRSRRQEQEAVEGLVRMLVAGMIIAVTVAACCFDRMAQLSKPEKLTLKDQTAMIQARWEASARARQEVRP